MATGTTRFARIVFWVGFSLYVAGLFLPAVGGQGVYAPKPPSSLGWAVDSFYFPFVYIHWHGFQSFLVNSGFDHISVAISGWINPIFLVTVLLLLMGKASRITSLLRYVVLFLIPFGWIAFMDEHVHPREGYFLWLVGVFLVLYCNGIQANEPRTQIT